jgi:outer membrane protein
MKRYFLLIIAALFLNTDRGVCETYDINKYLDAVKQQNKDIKLAVKEREMATVQEKEAKSSALPSIGMQADYNRNLTDYYMYFDKSALMPGASGLLKAPLKRDNDYSAALGLQQTLFSPIVGDAIKAASQYRKMTDYIYDASLNAVITGAQKLFYRCLLLKKVVEVARSTEENSLENYKEMKLKYDNGQVSEFELLQAETRWKRSIPETSEAERNLNLAINNLKSIAGIDMSSDIDLSGSLDTIPEMPDSVSITNVLSSRPDFQALTWENRLRKTGLSAAKNAYLPTLKGVFAYQYSGQSDKFEFDEENKFWYAGIKFSIPLYTGGAIDSKVQAAQVELGKTDIKIEKTKENLSTDLVNIYLRLKESKLRIESASSTVETAGKAFKIAETSSREGLATQLQLKDTRVVYDQSKIYYYSTVYDYLDAYFDWEYFIGKVASDK